MEKVITKKDIEGKSRCEIFDIAIDAIPYECAKIHNKLDDLKKFYLKSIGFAPDTEDFISYLIINHGDCLSEFIKDDYINVKLDDFIDLKKKEISIRDKMSKNADRLISAKDNPIEFQEITLNIMYLLSLREEMSKKLYNI